MTIRKLALLIGYGLLIIASSGCATKQSVSHTIDSESIEAVVGNPTGSTLPLKSGQTIEIRLKDNISILSRNVHYIRMVVEDTNTRRIRGKVTFAIGDTVLEKNDLPDDVEINLQDIEEIDVYDTEVHIHDPTTEWFSRETNELLGWILAPIFLIFLVGIF